MNLKSIYILFLFLCFGGVLYFPCFAQKQQKEKRGLKDVYNTDFLIGTALNISQFERKDIRADKIIRHEFNCITPENVLKAEVVQPAWGRFDFRLSDKFVDYGIRNNMSIVGHTLIWHSQLPPFVKNITSKDSLQQFMEQHIAKVAGRYSGKIKGWDVLNEALNEDGSFRNSVFLEVLGKDYITNAFKLAAMASPHTELYYNDYNIEQPAKRNGAITIIKQLQLAGARIDAIGIQGHWHLGKIPYQDIEESIIAFSELGVKVMITELDLEVLPRDFSGAEVGHRMVNSPGLNPYPKALPDSLQRRLATDYEKLFKLFLKHKDKISRVTFWGVADGNSWLNDWPLKGRTNYPLLFDRNYQPKEAYYKLINLKL